MPYLSEIQHRRVLRSDGGEFGRLADVAVMPREQFPVVQWAVLATPQGERVVAWSDLVAENDRYRLRGPADDLAAALPPGDALRLAKDLLDKQIVDTHGAKVVRVNDLQLEETGGQMRLV